MKRGGFGNWRPVPGLAGTSGGSRGRGSAQSGGNQSGGPPGTGGPSTSSGRGGRSNPGPHPYGQSHHQQPRGGGHGGPAPAHSGGTGGGFRRRSPDIRPEYGSDGLPFAKRQMVDRNVPLLSNTLPIVPVAGKPSVLTAFKVEFEGPRRLGIKDERAKRFLLGSRKIWGVIGPGAVASFRMEDGATLFLVDDTARGGRDRVAQLEGVTVQMPDRRRGTSEEWTLRFVEILSNSDAAPQGGLTSCRENPSLWQQFLTLVLEGALEAADIRTVGASRRIIRYDEPPTSIRNHNDYYLRKGYDKAVMVLAEGRMYLACVSRFHLMSYRTMRSELNEIFHRDRHLRHPDNAAKLNAELRRKKFFVVTAYCENNVYLVRSVDRAITPTSTFPLRERRQRDGPEVIREISHLEYLTERYGAQFDGLRHDPDLPRDLMVGVELVSRTRGKGVRAQRVVFVPAGLLNVSAINLKDVPRNLREDVTRLSQVTAKDSFGELTWLKEALSSERVQEHFNTFGLSLETELARVHGKNLLRSVTISMSEFDGGSGEIRLDENGDFHWGVSKNKYLRPPIVRDNCVVINVERDRQSRHAADDLISCFETEARKFGWDVRAGAVYPWDGSPQKLSQLEETIRARQGPRVQLLFGILPRKEEDGAEYRMIKELAWRLRVPSQCMTQQVFQKHRDKALFKMLAGLSAKIVPTQGGALAPWKALNPTCDKENVTFIGVATYKEAGATRADTRGGYGIVATTDDECVGVVNEFGHTSNLGRGGMLGLVLREKLGNVFRRLANRHKRTLQTLVVFRRGVTDSIWDSLKKTEVEQVALAWEDVYGKRRWNPESRTLTISSPQIRERGDCVVGVECMPVPAGTGGTRSAPTKEVLKGAIELVDSTGHDATLQYQVVVAIPKSKGEPIIHSASIAIKKSDWPKAIQLPPAPQIAYIAVNSNHAARLTFYREGLGLGPAEKRSGRSVDSAVPAGTIIDEFFQSADSSGKARSEYYIIPSTGPVGFATPVRYTILANNTSLTQRDLEEASLRLSYNYFNQMMGSRMPFIVKHAEMAAEKGVSLYSRLMNDGDGSDNPLMETHLFL